MQNAAMMHTKVAHRIKPKDTVLWITTHLTP